jgi:MarR family transcriptional regulator for hemolysin
MPAIPPPPHVALGDEVAKSLFTLTREWRHVLGLRLAPHGMSEATWRAMLHLDLLNGSAVQSLLAASMGIEGPSLVRLIDRMERDGWVRRRAHPQDRRVNVIEPTAKGQAVMQAVSQTAAEMRNATFVDFDLDELAQLSEWLERLQGRLQRQREEIPAGAVNAQAPC